MSDREILKEALTILFKSGMFKDLSVKTQQMITEDNELVEFIALQEAPSLELRGSYQEYEKHIFRLLEISQHEEHFYRSIIKVIYLILMCEKNPLMLNQLRHNSQDKEMAYELKSLVGS